MNINYTSGKRGRTLAIVTRSGLILYFSQANIVPSLPNAQMTLKSRDNMNPLVEGMKI